MSVSVLTVWDCIGCLRGVAAFAPVLLAPGYYLAWAFNLLGFRERPLGERLAWSVALSFAVVTIAAVVIAKFASLTAVCWLAVVCGLAAAFLRVSEIRGRPEKAWEGIGGWGGALIAAWCIFVIAELVDIGLGNRLYMSVTIYDHALRTAFVDAVMRTGVPPANPLYWPGHAVPMRYYYFWYVLTAVAARLGAATARQAMIASTVWSGLGLASVLALYSRHFLARRSLAEDQVRRGTARWPRTAIALGLLAVTGLDILPAIAKSLLRLPTDADMEWWSPDQISSWLDSLLWVPHHIAGLVCCLFGFLLVWLSKTRSTGQRALCSVLAGLAFASAFGLSTWVAIGFALMMLLWLIYALVWEKDSRPRVPVLLGAFVVTVCALTPYLRELSAPRVVAVVAQTGAASVAGNASHLLRFAVRHMIDPDCLLGIPWFAALAQTHPRLEDALAGLLLLVPGYFVELGFFGFILLLALRAARRSPSDETGRTTLMLAIAGLTVSTLLRSTVIVNNDFGIRSILIAQFFLLLLAVRWIEGAFGASGRLVRSAMLAVLWIGIAGSLYQAALLRLYLPVEDVLGRAGVSGLSERAMAWHKGFDAMNALRLPAGAVVQYDTEQPGDYFRYAQLMPVSRQLATAFPDCDSSFGGDSIDCPGVVAGVASLFHAVPVPGAGAARTRCASLGVTYLVATRWDTVWTDSRGWVWSLPLIVDTGDLRVVSCGA